MKTLQWLIACSKSQHPYPNPQAYASSTSPYLSDPISSLFSVSAILASLLFCKHGRHTPTSGPLHLLAPQPVKLFSYGLSRYLLQGSLVCSLWQWDLTSPSPASSLHSCHSLPSSMLSFSPQQHSDVLNTYLFTAKSMRARAIFTAYCSSLHS